MFEIGNSLREARIRQGLDYSQVELATKIRAKYIRALEEEEFEMLPSTTYIKGFMRSYAEFLGLDGQIYVDEYNSRHVVDGFDDMPQRRPRVRRDRPIERKVVLLTLAGIAAVTALVIAAWNSGGGGPSTATPPVVKRHATVPAGLHFVARGKGTYLVVRRGYSGGPVLYQATLRGHESGTLAGKRFWLLVHRPSGVRVTLGGKLVRIRPGRNVKLLVKPAHAGG